MNFIERFKKCKVKTKLGINLIAIIIFTAVYILLALPLYYHNVDNEGAIFYFAIAIVLINIIIGSLNYFFLNIRGTMIALAITSAILILFGSTYIILNRYGCFLSDYSDSGYNTLFYLSDYKKQKSNYLTVYKAVRQKGVKVNSIDFGLTGKSILGGNDIRENIFEENPTPCVLYAINYDKYYILFDWKKREIVEIKDGKSVLKEGIEFLAKSMNINASQIKEQFNYPDGVWGYYNDTQIRVNIVPNNYTFTFVLDASSVENFKK